MIMEECIMIRSIRRMLGALLAAVLLLGCLPGLCLAETDAKKATVMIYMCGADLEGKHGQGTACLGEIIQSRFNTEEINVVVLIGGSLAWKSNYPTDELTLLKIEGRRPQVIESFPLASMGEPETLSSFLKYCYENFPAEQYVLNMWDHGGGPILGLMQDFLFSYDTMSMNEFVSALENSPFKSRPLDLMMLHACLMSSAEVSSMVAPYARYMVASEDSFFGFAYDWLTNFDTDTSIVDTAKLIVDSTFTSNKAIIEAQNAVEKNSIALIDLSKIAALESALDNFFPKVSANLDDVSFSGMSSSRRDSATFGISESGGFSNYDLVDLGDLVANAQDTAPAEAQAVLGALSEAVLYCRSDDDAGCTGLTVYHPFSNKDSLDSFVAVYNDLGFSEGYTDYMHRFVSLMTGSPLADWTDLHTDRALSEKAVRTLFTMELTDEQLDHYGDSRFEALHKHDSGSYTKVFVNNETSLEGAALTGEFKGTALYAVTGDGIAITPALEYSMLDNDTYILSAKLTQADQEPVRALVYCSLDAQTKQLVPGRVYVWDETMHAYTGAFKTSFAEYDTIELSIPYRKETRNEQGTLLPFDLWEISKTETWSIAIEDSWAFALLEDSIDTADLYAAFEICDSQNNFYTSEPLAIKAAASVDSATRVTYDDAQFVIGKCTVAVSGGQMMLTFDIRNACEQETVYELGNMLVNNTPVAVSASVYGSGENWGLLKDEEQHAMASVSLADIEGEALDSITFDLACLDAATNELRETVPVHISLHYSLDNAQ